MPKDDYPRTSECGLCIHRKKMTKSARSCSVLEQFPRCNDYLIAANDFSIGKSLEKSRVCLCVELLGFLFTPCSHSAPILFHFPSGFFSSFSSIIFSLPHTEQCEHYLVPLAAQGFNKIADLRATAPLACLTAVNSWWAAQVREAERERDLTGASEREGVEGEGLLCQCPFPAMGSSGTRWVEIQLIQK